MEIINMGMVLDEQEQEVWVEANTNPVAPPSKAEFEAVLAEHTEATGPNEPVGRKIPANIDHRIIEVDVGRFQNKPNTSAKKEFGLDVSELLDKYEYDFTSSVGGETSEQVEARVRAFINDLKLTPYKKVVVITHGGILRWFYYICNGEKISKQPNAKEHYLKV